MYSISKDFLHIYTSVADPDPGSGAFLTPGSQTHIFESLVTTFWVKVVTNPDPGSAKLIYTKAPISDISRAHFGMFFSFLQ